MEEACSALKTHNHSAMCLYKLTQTMRVKQTSFIFLLFFFKCSAAASVLVCLLLQTRKKKKKKKKAKAGDFFSELNMSVCFLLSFKELLKRAALRYLTQFTPITMERKKKKICIQLISELMRAASSTQESSAIKKGEGERSADCCFHAITLHLFFFFVRVLVCLHTLRQHTKVEAPFFFFFLPVRDEAHPRRVRPLHAVAYGVDVTLTFARLDVLAAFTLLDREADVA